MAFFDIKKTHAHSPSKEHPLNKGISTESSPEPSDPISSLIRRRRLQILVHSYLYYEKDTNLVEDAKWSDWAVELCELQKKYPDLSSKVRFAEAFKDFDGSTGAFLPLDDKWVVNRGDYLEMLSRSGYGG